MWRVKRPLTDIESLKLKYPRLDSIEQLISSIESAAALVEGGEETGVCMRCKAQVGAELTKITDIKDQILSRAKLSVSKHLR